MTNNINKEDDTETALDYIQRQEKLEKDAQDILPGNFDKCTFSLGYIRQPLYACKTCTVDQNEEPAGMCYSCSIACHASHDLFELFPKRAFRCDCGLSGKFGGHACSRMVPEKLEFATNEKNQYNHNFMNLYCRCNQTYDPEKEEETMYQCIACEDWFHERCIGNIPEAIDEFDCYICRDCTKKYPFLMNGNDAKFSYGLSKGDAPIHQWILPESQVKETQQKESSKAADSETAATTNGALDAEPTAVGNQDIVCLDQGDATTGEKRKREEEEESTNKQDIIANVFKKARCESNCQNVDTSLLPEHDHIEIFLQDDWRQSLCKCVKCMEDYKTNQVEYLLEEEQTVEPENDEDVGKSLLEVGMEQLQRMDRVQAIESVRAFQTLASDLKQFFGTFKEEGKIVTKEDVQEYFDAKRRERQQQQ
ncbi:hypothetical protein FB192DRAFT_1369286 [Mucor lusitanicus]|uniref:UBR-type domain-containing protein n=2 Tax=Mucor circinelloides f. lusitanicus TaxID=29924 RepID=A0A162R5B0_MUCCL|nr:hypothetical protein FB192DRAFT_1369286 [Mucor lusitanicus]OAD08470.1 hypothetical protein MUCCIDRAFT_182487 [Mucor lusitanicus CBS 277.49]